MTISSIYDQLKKYIDLKVSDLSDKLRNLFVEYKTKEVGNNIDAVKTVSDNVNNINTNLKYIDIINTTSKNIQYVQNTGRFIKNIQTNAKHIGSINYVAYNCDSIKAITDYYKNNNIQVGANAQFLGNQPIKAIQYMSNTNSENIVIKSGLSAFAIDHLDNTNNASLTIENGAVFKIL